MENKIKKIIFLIIFFATTTVIFASFIISGSDSVAGGSFWVRPYLYAGGNEVVGNYKTIIKPNRGAKLEITRYHAGITGIKIVSLPSGDSKGRVLGGGYEEVGEFSNFKLVTEGGREVSIGDIIYFGENKSTVTLYMGSVFKGYDNIKKYTSSVDSFSINGIKLESVDSYNYKDSTEVGNVYLRVQVNAQIELRAIGSDKMDFGTVIAGEVANAKVVLEATRGNLKGNYEVPEFAEISTGKSNINVYLTKEVIENTGENKDRIIIKGSVQTEHWSTGKYKGSFTVRASYD